MAAEVLAAAVEVGILEGPTFVPDETAPVEEDAREETAGRALDIGAVGSTAEEDTATLEDALVAGAEVAAVPLDAATDCSEKVQRIYSMSSSDLPNCQQDWTLL